MPPKPTANLLPPQDELDGRAALAEALDLSPEHADVERMATIQLNAGGKCVGNLAEFIAIPQHEPIKAGVIQAAEKAKAEDRDVVEAVENALGLFAQRDEQGKVVRATHAETTPAQIQPAESKKK